MSKRALKKYLQGLEKEHLEEQLLELYSKFKPVKVYYDFVFNPQEEKLVEECKMKISKEYFPLTKRRPRMRRSVAQKYIKHFMQIGMAPDLLLDVMLYNIELAQTYCADKPVKQDTFYKSMLTSFEQAVVYAKEWGEIASFHNRLLGVVAQAEEQNWFNAQAFDHLGAEYLS